MRYLTLTLTLTLHLTLTLTPSLILTLAGLERVSSKRVEQVLPNHDS